MYFDLNEKENVVIEYDGNIFSYNRRFNYNTLIYSNLDNITTLHITITNNEIYKCSLYVEFSLIEAIELNKIKIIPKKSDIEIPLKLGSVIEYDGNIFSYNRRFNYNTLIYSNLEETTNLHITITNNEIYKCSLHFIRFNLYLIEDIELNKIKIIPKKSDIEIINDVRLYELENKKRQLVEEIKNINKQIEECKILYFEEGQIYQIFFKNRMPSEICYVVSDNKTEIVGFNQKLNSVTILKSQIANHNLVESRFSDSFNIELKKFQNLS